MARLLDILRGFRVQDVVDIALLTAIIYWLLRLIKGTRTIPILVGLTVLVGAYAIAAYVELDAIQFVMEHLFSSAVVIMVVLFQGDIRNALAELGMTTMLRELSPAAQHGLIVEVVAAAEVMARRRIGATIVLENETGLRNFVERGKPVNAPPSVELLESIFNPGSPLHDGAVIISRDGLLAAARCILPLTAQALPVSFLGTRHRSALGLSDETDAVILVISEETGQVSLAFRGKLYRDLDAAALRREITHLLMGEAADDARSGPAEAAKAAQG